MRETETQTKCQLCEDAPAEAIKIEAEITENEDSTQDIITKVEIPICLACSEDWYDGTEEFPGVLPLI